MQNDAMAPGGALLADLNSPQREAVTHPDGPLLILAGAGSGKTRVLTRRIAYLVRERGLAPEQILALTFTNKAAGEMIARIEALLHRPARGLWIGTFHSICLRLIRMHTAAAGYRPGLSVFDAEDQLTLMRRLLKAEGFEAQPRRAREMLGLISNAKSRGQGAEEMQAAARTPAAQVAARLYAAYQTRLREQNALDFDDLLLVALRMLLAQADLARRYQRRFAHVLVDEYQDTNHIQFRFVELLAREHRNIFVVGDDDQSIYGWRGADVGNIIDFREHFADATVLRLTQNYRSTAPILALANALIRHNRSRWEKDLWTERTGGQRPHLFVAGDEDEEAEEIARRVVAQVSSGAHRYGQVAVFYRTHAQSRALEDALLRSQIPYVLIGGVYFYQRREVKDLLSYLRLLVNPSDEVSLRRAASVPRRGLGEVALERLLAESRRSGRDVLAVAAEGGPAGLRGGVRGKLADFGRQLLAWRTRTAEPPERILTEIIEAIDYRRYLEEQGGDWEERLANAHELIEGARLFSSARGGGVADYLDQVSLLTSADELPEAPERVTLMTAHNAKGLEFPVVFVCGLEEGLFPHVSAFDDEREMEEERRLFYVACTRAMDELTLSACEMRRRYTSSVGGVSRFLGEIPPDLYEETDLLSQAWEARAARRPAAVTGMQRRRTTGSPRAAGAGGTPMAAGGRPEEHPLVGRRVYHSTFGPGLVVAAEGEGSRARVTVRFHGGATRKVLSGYLEWED
jgi:DNA helicase-2/ATP-dependent DNA helicase PcrA